MKDETTASLTWTTINDEVDCKTLFRIFLPFCSSLSDDIVPHCGNALLQCKKIIYALHFWEMPGNATHLPAFVQWITKTLFVVVVTGHCSAEPSGWRFLAFADALPRYLLLKHLVAWKRSKLCLFFAVNEHSQYSLFRDICCVLVTYHCKVLTTKILLAQSYYLI